MMDSLRDRVGDKREKKRAERDEKPERRFLLLVVVVGGAGEELPTMRDKCRRPCR